jgi:integrase
MVLQMPRPFKHPKTGVYYFRMRVPRDLVGIVGKAEVKISLATKDPALAKELFSDRERQVAMEWKALRAAPEPIPHRQIVALAGKLYHSLMAALEDEPGESGIWNHILRITDAVETAGELEQWYGPQADQLLREEGIATDATSRARLLRETHTAFRQFAEQQLKRSQGDYSPDPNAARFPALGKPKADAGSEVGILDLFELWKRDHLADNKSARTPRDHLQKVEDFIAFVGHGDAKRVTPQNIAEWSEALRHERGLSAKTVNDKYLSAIRAVFGVGVAKYKISSSPAEKVRVKVPKRVRERPLGFTDAEAKQILSHALKALGAPGNTSEHNRLARRWIPWICAYTGARCGEVSQLRREDFFEEHGVPCIRITPEAGTVKTGQYRIVPVHPHLVDMGLLDFVRSRRDGPLFFVPNNRQRKEGNSQAQTVTGHVSDWVRDVVKITDARVQPNHGWRHRFKTVARDVDIPHKYMDVIQGHSDGSAGSDYGETTMKALYREIQKLPRYLEQNKGVEADS